MNMIQLEAAYDAGRISEQRYDQLKDQLEEEMDQLIDRAELDYERGKISKETYRKRVKDLERRYEGED
jgi:mRNA-degrading endonuclease RelE of RelBE toxin-antitoxin system